MSSSAQNGPRDTHLCSVLGVTATKGDASQPLGLSANAVIELKGGTGGAVCPRRSGRQGEGDPGPASILWKGPEAHHSSLVETHGVVEMLRFT